MSINVILCNWVPECFKCKILCQFLLNVGKCGMNWMRIFKALPMSYHSYSNFMVTENYNKKLICLRVLSIL